MTVVAHTFSIVGRSQDGQLGVAVSSCVPAVGAACPFVAPHAVAISCQAYTHPYLALDLIARNRDGESVSDAAVAVLDADEGREWRQLIAIGPAGAPFVFTGAETDPWSGHVARNDCAAAGNLLVSEQTVVAMADAFDASPDESLAERLLRGLEAGQAAGGDRRGRQSAALLTHASEQMPFVSLRVDDHPNPVAELRRVFGLYSPDDLARALRTATTRAPRPMDEIRARQAQVRQALEEQGR
jgi:uncharacterized Ntn-hydrolase superfamily protein